MLVAVLAFLPAVGCGDDGPDCAPDVLDNTAEEALARHVFESTTAMTAGSEGSPVGQVVDSVAAFHRDQPPVDADPCSDRARALTIYELIVHDLVAQPDVATSELVSGLVDAAQKGGIGGLLNFVEGADFTDQQYPGLGALRELLDGQAEAVESSLRLQRRANADGRRARARAPGAADGEGHGAPGSQ